MKGVDCQRRELLSPHKFFLPREAVTSLEGILIPQYRILRRVREMSKSLAEEYRDKELYIIGILNGAIPFYGDLLYDDSMDLSFESTFVSASSYKGTTSSQLRVGKLNLKKLRQKDVLILDDILDTGQTLQHYVHLVTPYARSVKVAVLLDKPLGRKVPLEADYVGFVIPNVFVVGYGLDYKERFRYLKHIAILKQEVYNETGHRKGA